MNLVQIKHGQITTYPDTICQIDNQNTHTFSADSTLDDIEAWLTDADKTPVVLFEVADFKDGRIFSLIKHLRHRGYQSDIYVCGQFSLDQANYFVKSGATGFLVTDEKLSTLKHTLYDLQTGHLGICANALPMFRG